MTQFWIFHLSLLLSWSETNVSTQFVRLQNFIPSAVVDARYFSNNNFVGAPIDGYESSSCYITKQAAFALKEVELELQSQGLGIKVFDAYRPQRAVNHFVRWAKDLDDTLIKAQYYPDVPKSQLFEKGYIAEKSGHSRGSTVDLTLVYTDGLKKGNELDMGSGWDFFGTISWPSNNAVSPLQKANRMKLKSVMLKHGFKPYSKEWWHFTLKDEPFPDRYFDFVVK